jgi:hypothetical protein
MQYTSWTADKMVLTLTWYVEGIEVDQKKSMKENIFLRLWKAFKGSLAANFMQREEFFAPREI